MIRILPRSAASSPPHTRRCVTTSRITTTHIDLIADTAVGAGALGARMTGGGFGGCVIALVPADRAEAVVRRCAQRCTPPAMRSR